MEACGNFKGEKTVGAGKFQERNGGKSPVIPRGKAIGGSEGAKPSELGPLGKSGIGPTAWEDGTAKVVLPCRNA